MAEKFRISAAGDPIRIVPLFVPSEMAGTAHGAPAGPPPQLTYRNGPLVTAAEIFTIFWGASWNQPPLNAMAQTVNQFFDFILTSALMDQMAEYSVPGKTIGHGKRTGTITLASPALHTSITDRAIQHMLHQEISSNAAFPQPNANSIYFVYLPAGVRVVQGGGSSCQAFCGYHSDITGQIYYAVLPYPGCLGCAGGLTAIQALTSTTSHELCEAITDPIPGQGWYDDANGEIGDICAWKSKTLGNYSVQLEWSNKQNACV